MKITRLVSLGVLALLLAVGAQARDLEAEGWDLTKHNKRYDIKVYQKQEEGYEIRSFYASAPVEATIPELLTMMTDEELALKMTHKVKSFRVLEQTSSFEALQYIRIEAPYPVKDRDVVLRANLQRQPGKVVITSKPDPTAYPEQDGVVRMPEYSMVFTMTPQMDGTTFVEIQGYGNPGGFVPAWAVNLTLNSVPYMTLKKLQRGAPRYKDTVDTSQYDMWATEPLKTATGRK